jgi:DNA-binding NtrC family response regulator
MDEMSQKLHSPYGGDVRSRWGEGPGSLKGAPDGWTPVGPRRNVLVAEDNPDVAELVMTMLEHGGFRPIVASDGREALDLYRSWCSEISLVILDLLMPKMSGQQCLKELLKLNPDVRVIAMSGYYHRDEVMDEIGQHISGFIAKPCRLSVLLQETMSALDS